jgi:hypothetical protein
MDYAAIITALSTMNSLQIIGVIIILLILTNSGNILKFIKNKFSKNKNPHASCINSRNLEYTIQRYIDRAIKVERLKESILPTQMSAVDKAVINIKSLLMDNYKNMNPPPKDIVNFDNILFKTMFETKEILRDWIKLNHLLDKTDIEFREYVKETKSLVEKYHISLLSKEYNSEYFKISREEMWESNSIEVMPKIDDALEELLFKIRDIVREKTEEIEALEKTDFF